MPSPQHRRRAASKPGPDEALRLAMQAHGAGHLDVAQTRYQALLSAQPRHPDALHLFGVLQAQRGHHERAAELIGRAIVQRPREAMFHNNLGNVWMERGRLDEAEACYRQALQLDPGRFDALNNLGVLWSNRGLRSDAEQALQRVTQQAPAMLNARLNLANHFLRFDQAPEAERCCREALATAPRHAGLREALGKACLRMGQPDEAARVYRDWLELEPGHPQAMFLLAACSGVGAPDRAPDRYLQDVFDAFAGSFDAQLAALSYQAPARVADAVARHAGAPAKALRMLDAGCGTGLCGPLLAPYAAQLTGVDLSDGMLRHAKARGVYDQLLQAELVGFLQQHPGAFDVIVSADTLIYFGALEAFAGAAHAALHDGGLLSFTVEAHDDSDPSPGHRLQPNGRYSHRRTYVERVLTEAGLSMVEVQSLVLRTELGSPVAGWLVTSRCAWPG